MTYTALITPFHKDGSFDEEGFVKLIEYQTQAQVDGIVILGSTGESSTVSEKERHRILRLARNKIKAPLHLIVGTGNASTEMTIEETKNAEKIGADAALIVTPYYNKPTQEGLYLHYQAVAKACTLPIILYNIAGRTGVNLSVSVVKRLISSISTIVGIKEASGNLAQIMDTIEMRNQERPEFKVFSGDDNFTLPVMSLGGDGVISVLSNLVPDMVQQLTAYCKNNEWEEARALHYQLLPLFRAIFLETNPIPIKTLMRFSDLPSGPCRLPLSAPSSENEKHLRHFHEMVKLSSFF